MKHIYKNQARRDEIDLVDLLLGLWQRKLLVLLFVIMGGVVSGVYLMVSKPVFETQAFIVPPSRDDIAPLNVGRVEEFGLEPFTAQQVYANFVRVLQSEMVARDFFSNVYLKSFPGQVRNESEEYLYEDFKQALQIGLVQKEDPDRVYVRFLTDSPERGKTWVARYLDVASEHARKIATNDASADADLVGDTLERKIEAARTAVRKQREDEIVRLQEALVIANAIGLEGTRIVTSNRGLEVSAGLEGALTYMRGSKALEVEIKNLQTRVSDDPFVKDLREQQGALEFYRGLRVDQAKINVYQLDGVVDSPEQPVKPLGVLMIAVGLVAGLVGGLLAAALSSVLGGPKRRMPKGR